MSDPAPGDPDDRKHELVEEILDDLPEVPHTPKRTSARELAFGDEAPSLIEAMGGPMGMIESAVPSAAFVVAITAGAETKLAAIISVGVAILFGISRLLRRETVQFAITGVAGVGISAAVAGATGKAKSFFLPSFLINVGYGVLALASVITRRPFVGYIADNLKDKDENAIPWREDPVKLRLYTRASMIWVVIFFGRLAVQIPFYLDDNLVALGTIKIIMSYPLFGIGVWLTWLMVREPPKGAVAGAATPAEPNDRPEPTDRPE